jgi:signal transduction histidine kinase
MISALLRLMDWFIPNAATLERSDLNVARNFVFTHLLGPTVSQSISVFLYRTDPSPGIECWTIIICVCLFWTLPFVLKFTQSLQTAAICSVLLLSFTSLFGAFFYGGVSSPFLPWLIIALMLGFFYLHGRPLLVIGMFAANLAAFMIAYAMFGFPEIVPLDQLVLVGWISILSATVYMSWMAIYYAYIMSSRSELEREDERHQATAVTLRKAKELADSANRSKSVFLAKMSHELRTPLNAVIGYSEILLENIEETASEDGKRADLLRINAAGKHLLSLVTDVLDLSKIESDEIELKVKKFDLSELVAEVAETCRPLIRKSGNRLIVQGADGLGTVSTDPTKLRQVLMNLLGNAAKFTQEGIVSLVATRDRRGGADWIDIKVIDTGIGIDEASLGRLFRNFGQASAATARNYGGTGLGLVLSQRFCALMGGSIAVKSELGRGSLFSIRIPALLEAELPAQTPETADLPLTFAPA